MSPEQMPFNGNYIGMDGELHNMDGGPGVGPNESNGWMSPFYGVFVDGTGQARGLETVLSGGGNSEGDSAGSDINLPEGGSDGQALVKEGESLVWGNVASSADVASIQEAMYGLTTDNITEGTVNKYFHAAQVDQSIETNNSVMIKASYAINGASGKVDASVKADKISSAKNVSLSGDVSGTVSTDLSDNITVPTILANAGTAGTYMKVTTDAKGRVVSGAQLVVADVPALPLTKIDGLGTAAVKNTGYGADQIPTLDASGKLPSSVLPTLNSQSKPPVPVGSIEELVTLTDVEPGDKALLPNTIVYMLVASDPTDPANWVELTEDPDTVKQINGIMGPNVNLTTTNIVEGANLYFTNARADARADARIASSTLSNLSGGASVQAAINANTTGIQSIKTVNGLLKSNGAAVIAAVAGTDYAKPVAQIAATLAVGSWGTGNIYTISNALIAANSIGFLFLAQSATSQAYQAFMDARMYITSQATGSITITALGVKPTVAIPINIALLF